MAVEKVLIVKNLLYAIKIINKWFIVVSVLLLLEQNKEIQVERSKPSI